MQIKLEYVEFKNFRSYGNKPTRIEFKNGIDLIKGTNGQGKTTAFVHSLVYAFYGTGVYGENLSELINKHNKKDALVTVVFEKNSTRYRLVRGRTPNILEVYEDERLLKFDTQKECETYIAEELLEGINQNAFCSLFVVQTGNPAFSIFRMNKPQRRAIIESLFDLTRFKNMTESVKKDLDVLRAEYAKENVAKSEKENEITKLNAKMAEFRAQEKAFVTERDKNIDLLKKEIAELEAKRYNQQLLDAKKAELIKYEADIKKAVEVKTKIEAVEKSKLTAVKELDIVKAACDKLKSEIVDQEALNKKLEELNDGLTKKSTIDVFKSDLNVKIASCEHNKVCPVTSYLSAIDDLEDTNVLKNKIAELKVAIKKNSDAIAEFNKKSEKMKLLEANIAKFDEEIKALGDLKTIEAETVKLNSIKESIKTHVEDIALVLKLLPEKGKALKSFVAMERPRAPFTPKEIEALADQYKLIKSRLEEYVAKGKTLANLYDFLKKDTIKIFQVKNAFPPLKNSINAILKIFFDENVKVVFNADLEPIIYRGGVETSYATFSGGEKKRLDLAFLFAVREFLIEKNNLSMNALIMDELLDGELDEVGVECAFEYMNGLKGCDIMLITHKNIPYQTSRTFNVTKNKFSELTIKKDI